MSSQHHQHIVIGGGISGLSSAYYAARAGVDTVLLEREQRVGGCMHTHNFSELDHFWVEAGSHSCFNSYGNLLDILEDIGLLQRATPKEKQAYKLWRGGKRKSILSALHVAELVLSIPQLFWQSKSNCSVLEYYGRGLGKRNYRDLFGPAFRSVVCQTADEFPAEALFRKKPRRKEVLRNFTMPNGLSEIPATIAKTPGMRVELGQAVSAVGSHNSHFVIQREDGCEYTCDYLTLAVPPDIAVPLLRDIAPSAANAVGDIGMAEIDTLLLAFYEFDIPTDKMAGLISIDGPFLSAVSRDFMADEQQRRGFAFHFPGGRYEAAERIKAACDALDVAPDKPAAIAHSKNRLPSLRKGHQQLIDRLDQELVSRPLATTGNWFLGVSIEDCITRSRKEHARLFGSR